MKVIESIGTVSIVFSLPVGKILNDIISRTITSKYPMRQLTIKASRNPNRNLPLPPSTELLLPP